MADNKTVVGRATSVAQEQKGDRTGWVLMIQHAEGTLKLTTLEDIDVKPGDYGVFTYYDKQAGRATYHNFMSFKKQEPSSAAARPPDAGSVALQPATVSPHQRAAELAMDGAIAVLQANAPMGGETTKHLREYFCEIYPTLEHVLRTGKIPLQATASAGVTPEPASEKGDKPKPPEMNAMTKDEALKVAEGVKGKTQLWSLGYRLGYRADKGKPDEVAICAAIGIDSLDAIEGWPQAAKLLVLVTFGVPFEDAVKEVEVA